MEDFSPQARRPFLVAEWRDLVMLNYEADPHRLQPSVPRGTELDFFQGKTFVSLVGFRFSRTRLCGLLPIPFHTNFDEVNLRFYVRRREGEQVRRGVVFLREIVPRRAVARLARLLYGENYTRHPMRHTITTNAAGIAAEYFFRFRGEWCRLRAEASGSPFLPAEGSLEQFITEHYWGYAAAPRGGSLGYRVEHVPWRVWTATSAGFEGDGEGLYGPGFGRVLLRPPGSALIAEGSPVRVFGGEPLS